MDFVLDKVVNQRNESAEEQASEHLPVLQRPLVIRAQRNTAQGPRERGHEVRDHEDIMPIMVIARRDIRPATARQSPEHANAGNELGQRGIRARSQEVPQEDERESRAGGEGDEELENGPLGIPIANGRGDGGKPLIGVAVVFVLHDLVVVQPQSDDQCSDERRVRRGGMQPGHPFPVQLET